MDVTHNIELSAEQSKIVLNLLRKYLPNTTVWTFGSRVKQTSSPKSDLDLVVFTTQDQRNQVELLREEFEESDLTCRVDLLIWDELSTAFQTEIMRNYAVLRGDERYSLTDALSMPGLSDIEFEPPRTRIESAQFKSTETKQ